ncbi:hypothetical protein GGI04_002562 [Coemansia thaxteri]|uniref:Pyridoxal phosphate homeostasis protein n=1 Tax=Coemansia thaxteri TaxID=2663907 RepID=A0A9W8EG77_9FUNG|nr:hypothetical protein GGI04_002562 [Coemansia thaxteri]KAJ2005027.1 hypothetical protein H4R26_002179 [Coemansia thaxteri]KAJ2466104.1 hypothetical protein GGI02_004483 [Coemansia sp. RSA 2322]KAJ2485384.1 hypothetical protein EV174_001766 [Coemansia sp. RSA 2320]
MASTAQLPSSERRAEIEANLGGVGNAVRQSSSASGARLVAVSKLKPASDILAAYASGQRHFGENYVQELCEKAAVLPADIKWHFIGRLQSNKCKALAAVPNLWAVETIDSEAKARKLNDAWAAAGHVHSLNVFIQVNTSGEANKGGVEPLEVEGVVRAIGESCERLSLLGLMTIGSLDGSSRRPNPDFLCLRQLRDSLGARLELSMGMSDDYAHALELGATSVRVGSKIFGTRAPKPV